MKKYLAKISWFSEEGGRKKTPKEGMRYCPIIDIITEKNKWSIDFICPDFKRTDMIEFTFLAADAPEKTININEKYYLYEGDRKVAEVIIVE